MKLLLLFPYSHGQKIGLLAWKFCPVPLSLYPMYKICILIARVRLCVQFFIHHRSNQTHFLSTNFKSEHKYGIFLIHESLSTVVCTRESTRPRLDSKIVTFQDIQTDARSSATTETSCLIYNGEQSKPPFWPFMK